VKLNEVSTEVVVCQCCFCEGRRQEAGPEQPSGSTSESKKHIQLVGEAKDEISSFGHYKEGEV
jgi:hypothetical protein